MSEMITSFKAKAKQVDWNKVGMWSIIVLSVFRILLFTAVPYLIYGDAIIDDALLVDEGRSIYNGDWLGTYNYMTLIKGSSFPLFLALIRLLCIPYSVALGVATVIAGLSFVWAFKDRIDKRWIWGMYLFIIYAPYTMSYYTTQRVYRNALTPILTIIFFCLVTGICLRLIKTDKIKIRHILILGFVFAFFTNLREDSTWILPFLLVVELLELGYLIIKKNWRYIILLAVPFLVLFGWNTGVSALNYHYYGLYTTNDRAGENFGEMMGLLYSMEHEENNTDIWISKASMQKAIDASPSLQSIEEHIWNNYNGFRGADEQVIGDSMTWVMRFALNDAGYYSDAVTANEFCGQVVKELEAAYADGTLTKQDGIYLSAQACALPSDEILPMIKQSLKMSYEVARYDILQLNENVPGTGSTEQIRSIESFTGCLGEYPVNQETGAVDQVTTDTHKIVKVLNILSTIYHKISMLFVGVFILAYLYIVGYILYKRKQVDFAILTTWVLTTGMLLSAFVLLFGTHFYLKHMEVLHAIPGVNINSLFACGAYPLVQIAKYVIIYMAGKDICRIIRSRKGAK